MQGHNNNFHFVYKPKLSSSSSSGSMADKCDCPSCAKSDLKGITVPITKT